MQTRSTAFQAVILMPQAPKPMLRILQRLSNPCVGNGEALSGKTLDAAAGSGKDSRANHLGNRKEHLNEARNL